MAGAFQAMTAALYKRIEASEKFAADVAHELKNPLTAARSTAESLGYAKTDEQRDQLIEQIQIRAEAARTGSSPTSPTPPASTRSSRARRCAPST